MLQWKYLIICILIPLAVGWLSAILTNESVNNFATLKKPPLSPPGWLFPVVWTILFILMGIASYIIATSGSSDNSINIALSVYGIQLLFNFLWSIIFFNQAQYKFAFIWLLMLWILIFVTIILFYNISKPAGYLLIPYLIWVSFAGYLNLFIYLMN
jgi:tryptophan-rich sensory protein